MTLVNRSTIKTRNSAVSAGIDKHVPSSILVGGVSYTPPEIKGVFAAHTAALEAADALNKQWTDQVQAARDAGAIADSVHSSLRSFLIGQYGTAAHAVLNDFGMTAPKNRGPRAVSVDTKANAVKKREATRLARHTLGKVARKKITGETAAAAAAMAATPAPGGAPTTPAPGGAPTTPAPGGAQRAG